MRRGGASQKADVLAYLKEYGSITQKQAYSDFRAPITRLAAVIHELRKEGYSIATIERECENEYGKCRYAEYRLVN